MYIIHIIFIFLSFFAAIAQSSTEQPPVHAIAATHPLAVKAGEKIVASGGNAFDVAVTVAAVLAVVEPYYSGFGGGGFFLLHDASSRQDVFLDARERAPRAAHRDMYLDDKGDVIAHHLLEGGQSAAIPGLPAALVYLAEHYGNLNLPRLLAPAIKLAEHGFIVDEEYRKIVSKPHVLQLLRNDEQASNIFLKNGEVPELGDKIIQHDLAKTLHSIAEHGHDGFYEGTVAKKLVSGVRNIGGVWTERDLQDYQIKLRPPLLGQYRGMQIITAPLPSAGGLALITMLNILSSFDLAQLSEAGRIQRITEAMRLAYWDRAAYLGDPDYIDIPVHRLRSMPHADQLRRYVQKDKATPSETLPESSGFQGKSPNTTHFSIIDKQGNRVAATLSINYHFGSGVVPKGTGVLLNNHMDDFAIKPGTANIFGLIGSEENRIQAGKRPLSSMAPTFIIANDRIGILGASGGSRIPTMLLLAILEFAKDSDVKTWVSVPRFHHQYLPDELQMEADSFKQSLRDELASMGYRMHELKRRYGNMQVVLWDKKKQQVIAASDPRRARQVLLFNDD